MISSIIKSKYSNYTVVKENMDLCGSRGSKRFAYRAISTNLERKTITADENSAYTSIPCPSCGFVNKRNRSGIKFKCLSCGKVAHADWVGSINLLGRSEDKQITQSTRPVIVRVLLRARYRQRRNARLDAGRDSASGTLKQVRQLPHGQELTIGESIATNPV